MKIGVELEFFICHKSDETFYMPDIISRYLKYNSGCGLSTQRHTHLAVGGFRVLAPEPYLHVSMYTALH